MHVPVATLGLCLLLLWAAPAELRADRASPEAASGFAERPAVRADAAMVVSANPHASEAALATLRAGGSAFDAAMAAVLVLTVVEPQSAGIGGGAFLLHYAADRDEVFAWDGRETAPATADEDLLLDAQGRPLGFFDAVVGGLAVGVPGLLRLLEAAHTEHGRRPWAELFAPAIRLADQGFEVSPRLHALLSADRFLRHDAHARRLFYREDGAALPVGTVLRNPALADTLRALAVGGADVLYEGSIARDIAAAAQAAPNAGRLDERDLRTYRAQRRFALCGEYRGYRVCGMPPPSAGGGTVLAMLGLLEGFDLAALGPSAAAVHLFAEAGRLAHADRDAWYGDPDAMTLPVEALLAPGYLARRAAAIRPDASMGQAEPGRPDGFAPPRPEIGAPERPSTTHVSVVDADGNAVALTASIENVFGSRRMVRGFLLNNQLTDFSFAPRTADGAPHPNRVGPGRRPRSSMAPTLVFAPDGRLFAVSGSPGGSRIVQYVAMSLIGLIDWRLPPDALLARPHAGNRNGPTEVENSAAGAELARQLRAFGHEPVLRDMTSGLAIIVRDGDAWLGAADPRREGVAAGLSR